MEFHEKLQHLRKQNHLTQEQLAEQLYVSRTAVSKWESGRGYPNLESLKMIARLFGVSVDELLSGDALIQLVETENVTNAGKIFAVASGIMDTIAVAFLFLPLCGQQTDGTIRAVTLIAYHEVSLLLRLCYFFVLIGIFLFGILKIIMVLTNKDDTLRFCKSTSMIFHVAAILLFAISRQPYMTALLFVLFLAKMMLIVKENRMK